MIKLKELLNETSISMGQVKSNPYASSFKSDKQIEEDSHREGKMAKHDAMECASDSKDVSEDFPTNKIYLNNASVSLMPTQSIEAMKEFLISYNSIGPDSLESEPFVTEKLRNTRKIISKIINCQPDEIILTQSTTDGINTVANGLSFESPSNIIIRGMSHEHHANLYPWLRLKNKLEIYSIGDPGDLTYPYKNIGSNISIIRDIVSGLHAVSDKIKKSKKPLIIVGESALYDEFGEYVFETLKNFLVNNNFITKDWNALNLLVQQASRVGAIDLGIYSINNDDNFSFFNKLRNNDFKFLYLLGADNISIDKKDEFIIYQGSHGDKGAEIADIILPGAAYTEKNGLFINLEGSLQRAYKASYPPGDAREDWTIIKELADRMNKPLEYNNIQQLRESIYKEIKSKAVEPAKISKKIDFKEENISIKTIDYYYTNPIARSSKVMSECRQISKRFLSTGIEKAS